jgi:hypothetical protein
MNNRRSRLGDSGWDRFLAFEGFPWYYVVDHNIATREEERVIKRLGYYGLAITESTVAAIARGVPWSREQFGDARSTASRSWKSGRCRC